jgi:hypothetical protein
VNKSEAIEHAATLLVEAYGKECSDNDIQEVADQFEIDFNDLSAAYAVKHGNR